MGGGTINISNSTSTFHRNVIELAGIDIPWTPSMFDKETANVCTGTLLNSNRRIVMPNTTDFIAGTGMIAGEVRRIYFGPRTIVSGGGTRVIQLIWTTAVKFGWIRKGEVFTAGGGNETMDVLRNIQTAPSGPADSTTVIVECVDDTPGSEVVSIWSIGDVNS